MIFETLKLPSEDLKDLKKDLNLLNHVDLAELSGLKKKVEDALVNFDKNYPQCSNLLGTSLFGMFTLPEISLHEIFPEIVSIAAEIFRILESAPYLDKAYVFARSYTTCLRMFDVSSLLSQSNTQKIKAQDVMLALFMVSDFYTSFPSEIMSVYHAKEELENQKSPRDDFLSSKSEVKIHSGPQVSQQSNTFDSGIQSRKYDRPEDLPSAEQRFRSLSLQDLESPESSNRPTVCGDGAPDSNLENISSQSINFSDSEPFNKDIQHDPNTDISLPLEQLHLEVPAQSLQNEPLNSPTQPTSSTDLQLHRSDLEASNPIYNQFLPQVKESTQDDTNNDPDATLETTKREQ